MGKALEKVIQRRLVHFLEKNNLLSGTQHGFRAGRSCETALDNLLTELRTKRDEGKHTAVISLDIRGAFDNVRWDDVKARLRDIRCPLQLRGLLSTYLEERSIQVHWGNGLSTHSVSKGCPQGSCLGPVVWLLIAEVLLQRVSLPPETGIQAYADDFVLLVSDRQRTRMEEKGRLLLHQFETWLEDFSLQASAAKSTSTIIMRRDGCIQRYLKRPPIFKLHENSIPNTPNFRYLGVTISRGLTWTNHLATLKVKLHQQNQGLLKVTRATWGVNSNMLKYWYETVTKPTVTYAASCWGGELRSQEKAKLASLQRPFLIRITRAWRTTSTSALQVLSGIPPLHLEIEKEFRTAMLMRLNKDVELNGTTISSSEYQKKCPNWFYHPSEQQTRGSWYLSGNPPKTTLNIYTDGSKREDRVGLAFVVYQEDREIAIHQERLRSDNSVFQAELNAIEKAIDWLIQADSSEATIHSDSYSALLSIRSLIQTNPVANRIRTKLNNLVKAGKQLNVSWVKAHVGITGNERADQLAKEATESVSIRHDIPLPSSALRNTNNKQIMSEWQHEWDTSDKGRKTHQLFPKVVRNRLVGTPWHTTLFTGHGPYRTYQARFLGLESSLCICGQPGDELHYATNCSLTAKWHVCPCTEKNKKVWGRQLLENRKLAGKIKELWQWLLDNSENLQSIS